ncbi:oxygenase [Lithospermum erythrorhizon]|uniref:carotenoid 9,10-dioxygenase n=1 Tax=Lithospermum erythrorhizon TaxID=34254 RepID=A0AAV3PLI4_LITER
MKIIVSHALYVDVIYVTKEGDLKTLGINNYEKQLDHWLTPHPKKDPQTKEMFTFGSRREKPYCIYRKISEDGVMGPKVDITVDRPTYMHDLCITEHYVIFQELPYVYDPEVMQTSDHEWIFHFADGIWPRYGFLKRNATSEDKIRWFEFTNQSFFVFHNANAWEVDKDTIVLYCCIMESNTKKDGSKYIFPADFQRYDIALNFEISWPQLYKMTFDMKNNTAIKENISSNINGDFPKINEKYMGRKSKYIYISEVNRDNKIKSVVKYYLDRMKENRPYYKRFEFGTDIFAGEVVFVPKNDDKWATNEDDGYLIVFAHHEVIDKDDPKKIDSGISYVYVIDAKRMISVAKLQLPTRVPYGFHAIYVTEKELLDQKP